MTNSNINLYIIAKLYSKITESEIKYYIVNNDDIMPATININKNISEQYSDFKESISDLIIISLRLNNNNFIINYIKSSNIESELNKIPNHITDKELDDFQHKYLVLYNLIINN